MIYLKYLKSVLRHKWFVFIEACKLGVPLLGLLHDLSKFLPDEFIPYARYFYGEYPVRESKEYYIARNNNVFLLTKEDVERAFNLAWLKHQRRNKHHWQWWFLMNDRPEGNFKYTTIDNYAPGIAVHGLGVIPFPATEMGDFLAGRTVALLNNGALPMPDRYRREMLADWRGAGRAYGNPDTKGWYQKTTDGRVLHPETQKWIEDQLGI
jgi:hypothetical protein